VKSELCVGKKRHIQESYDSLGGELYDERYRDEQNAKYDALFRIVSLNANDVVLDDGCGTGLLLERVGTRAVGLDFSSMLIAEARSKLKKKWRTNLIQSDSEHLPFRCDIFSKVFAITVLQNLQDPMKAYNEINRVANTSSKIVVTALKKSFSLNRFKQLISSSKLTLEFLIEDENLKDWIACMVARAHIEVET
jgi:ubiquinone/menaquinone biosynthesis C-methylase UbiE